MRFEVTFGELHPRYVYRTRYLERYSTKESRLAITFWTI